MNLRQLAARILVETVARTYINIGRHYGWTGEFTAEFAIQSGGAILIADLLMPGPLSVLVEIMAEDYLRRVIVNEMAPYVEFVVIEMIVIEGPIS